MLVLLSFALVLGATVLLVLGLLNDGLALIYLSIACSAGAAIVLMVAWRRSKRGVETKAEVDFPIADYDELTAGQILPLLPLLLADELAVVEARERVLQGRPDILERVAQLRGAGREVAAAEAPATKAPETGDA